MHFACVDGGRSPAAHQFLEADAYPARIRLAQCRDLQKRFHRSAGGSTASLSQRLEQSTTRLEALPGVASAAAVSNLPTQLVADLPFDIIGRAKDRKDASGDEKYVSITEHYFDALHVPSSQAAFTTGQTTMAPRRCSS
jgi:hypothetical protein